jgi:transposase
MSMKLRYIGLDVHKETIVIAVAEDGRGPVEAWKTIPYDVARLIKAMELLSEGAAVSICYEAAGIGVRKHKRAYGSHTREDLMSPKAT